jgi:DNA-3-methyladenine glycosylase I
MDQERGMSGSTRREGACAWAETGDDMRAYHDREWGVPVHDDARLFEFLVLDAFQAGLSWAIILRKRENFRAAFDGFDAASISRYGDSDVARLLVDAGIVRNKQKIHATIGNARAFLEIQQETGSFDGYVWKFVEGSPIQNRWRSMAQIPARTAEAEALSRDLVARGFKFVGPTICYAFMQAAGLVNDHVVSCFRHEMIRKLAGA